MYDRTGRELRVGQTVDIEQIGMLQGIITQVHEVPIVTDKDKRIPAHVVINIALSHIPHDGLHTALYIIHDVPEEVPRVIQ